MGHRGRITSAALSPDGLLAVSGPTATRACGCGTWPVSGAVHVRLSLPAWSMAWPLLPMARRCSRATSITPPLVGDEHRREAAGTSTRSSPDGGTRSASRPAVLPGFLRADQTVRRGPCSGSPSCAVAWGNGPVISLEVLPDGNSVVCAARMKPLARHLPQ